MGLILILLILAILLGLGGFAVHVLWILALIFAIAYVLGWGLSRGWPRS
jgi:hypothetical protein